MTNCLTLGEHFISQCHFSVLLSLNVKFVSLQLKKSIKPPEMPSKHVRNWVPKVLEQRRQGLELYLQVMNTPLLNCLISTNARTHSHS